MTYLAALAAACPDCLAGREARALVVSDAFWLHAWYAALPFAVVTVVVRWFARRLDEAGDPPEDTR